MYLGIPIKEDDHFNFKVSCVIKVYIINFTLLSLPDHFDHLFPQCKPLLLKYDLENNIY